jgi:ABC-type transport system involved in multi-copper enzyme maturation permease subunit
MDIIFPAYLGANINSVQSGDDEMEDTIVAIIISLFGFLLVLWINRLCFKKENEDIYLLTIIELLFVTIFFAMVLLFSDYLLSKEETNSFTIVSLILAIMALLIALILEMGNGKIFANLNLMVNTLNKNDSEIDQNTQQIIAQINHLEESQEITERLDRIETHLNDRFPPQSPHDDDPADLKKVRTTKEYIRASFSGRCHKTGSK